MPIHDWTRVSAGSFHHFHVLWIGDLSTALNRGGLPAGYYAYAEHVMSKTIPDVVTLKLRPHRPPRHTGVCSVAVADAPPKTRFVSKAAEELYLTKVNRITIRNPEGEVVAIVEIVSPGNKHSRQALAAFVGKAARLLRSGINLLIIDLFPPTRRDPNGIHKAIWEEIMDEPFELPPDKPLTLAAYEAGSVKGAYVEPIAVGDALPSMPLFLEPGLYIPAPLETTYMVSWEKLQDPTKDALLGLD